MAESATIPAALIYAWRITDVLISPTNGMGFVPLHAIAMFEVALDELECKTGDMPTMRRFTDQEFLTLIQQQ